MSCLVVYQVLRQNILTFGKSMNRGVGPETIDFVTDGIGLLYSHPVTRRVPRFVSASLRS